jgi:4-hydroxythreonine-4-phosphate dehydrogenase
VALPIGISMGDPAGIGPETVIRLFAEGTAAPCIVFGDAAALRRACGIVGADLAIRSIETPGQARCARGSIEVIQVGAATDAIPFGHPDPLAGGASVAYVLAGGRAALDGRTAALVTGPISKEAWAKAGVAYPGHTELLAAQAGVAEFAMMLANAALRVVLVSIHVPLIEAVRAVTPAAEARAIRLADTAARRFGIARPRVAVAGLNPHAGENGNIGHEDVEIIAPAVAAARAAGIDASGPWPGDTVFMRAREGEFDIVVAQYHDQGLIPIKYLGLADGANVTLGLPYVRTSPDHGTAFDIAGTGRASAASLHAALKMALRLIGA